MREFIRSNIAGAMEELCTAENEFVPVEEIAKSANLHPDATYRLLRFLSTFDVCVEGKDRSFKLGSVGAVVTPNHPQSVAKNVLWESSNTPALHWRELGQFLKTNEKVVRAATGEDDIWAYFAKNESERTIFQQAMTGYSNEEAFFLSNEELSPTLDLSNHGTVCDLGAAEGTLPLMLTKRFPDCNYIISDLPECTSRIDKSTLPSNLRVEAADFFEGVPNADAYLLKHIIHDWDDERATRIFENILKANPKATVFVLEFGPMPGANAPHLAKGFGELVVPGIAHIAA